MRGVFECTCNSKLDQNKMYNYTMNSYQVPYEERSKVYQDTVKKLCSESTGWPNCTEDQIFRLSTKEAMFIQDTPERYIVGHFAAVLHKINGLIPESRHILLINSARFVCVKNSLRIKQN